jgi:phage shock protein A
MEITKKSIESRLAQLRNELAQAQANLAQMQANLNAYQGAIQDCEFWLAAIDAQQAEEITTKTQS